jgi:hypothetical protein
MNIAMLTKFNAILLSFFLVCTTVTAQSKTAYDHQVLYGDELNAYGRYSINNHNLKLISSAVHFGFTFTGKECLVYASVNDPSGHNYLQYELDGVYQKRIKVNGGAVQPITLSAGNNGTHTVWIYKATEAQTGPIYIQKITGTQLHILPPGNQPLIEFIGNSITCGAAADTSDVPCGVGDYHDHHNAYNAYGPRVARALGANYILSSVSGIGVYRNWNSDGPTMPQVYEKTDLTYDSTQQWNFAKYNPAIVSIALGTNDMSRGDGVKKRLPFDSAQFTSHYIQFVQLVKRKYPHAQIALLSSPMMHGGDRELLQNYLTVVKKSVDALYPASKPVAVFFFEPMQAGGCSGHPSVEDHGKMAEQLLPFFKKLL